MNLIVQGLLTNYKTVGSGKVVLLLHGWGDSLSTYDSLTVALKDKYKIVRLDLPGFGKTETPSQVYNLELFASFVSAFLEKIDVQDVYAIVGHSNGGAIAVKGLSSGVLSSKKLVLLAASGIRTDHSMRKKSLRIVAKTAKLFTSFLPKNVQKKLKKKVYAKIGSDIFVAEDMQETFKQVLVENVVSEAHKIKADTLLVYGDKDTATPVRYGESFAKEIKKAQLEIVKEAGHFLHHTHSSDVESKIRTFLDKS